MGWTLEVENYRALRSVRWSPDPGVSCLVGPNGAGKTTLLSIPQLMATAGSDRSFGSTLDLFGGPQFLRHVDSGDKPVALKILDEAYSWKLEPSLKGQAWGEELVTGAATYSRALGAAQVRKNNQDFQAGSGERTILFHLRMKALALGDRYDGEHLWRRLSSYRRYLDYDIKRLREYGSPASTETELAENGENALSVLRNWRDQHEEKFKFELVNEGLKECFPFFEELNFSGTNIISGGFVRRPSRRGDRAIPFDFAPNGLLVALLHLVAVASTPRKGIVAIDEVESSLHPEALQKLLNVIEEFAEEEKLTVLLTTQSPMVLDCFESNPERVWVLDQAQEKSLCRLTDLRDKDWLSHFRLGQLFMSNEFGGSFEPPRGRCSS